MFSTELKFALLNTEIILSDFVEGNFAEKEFHIADLQFSFEFFFYKKKVRKNSILAR